MKDRLFKSICVCYAKRKENNNLNVFNNRDNIKNMVAKRFQNER